MKSIVHNLTGQVITAKSGNKYTLTKVAGEGTQGVVFEEASGKSMIKLYYPSKVPLIEKDIIEKLAFVKNVKKPKNFVEIRDLIVSPHIGYVMDRVVGHESLNTYLIPNPDKKFAEWYHAGLGFRERLYIGYVIAKTFRALSTDNLSYCDISGNNILVRVYNKEISVRMIDIDNIYVAGSSNPSIIGTPRYIAPELISKSKNPDVFSDNYSLATILFELLRIGHPYISDEIADGSAEDEEAAFIGKADYVSDSNSSNMLPSDIVFTDKLKQLFEQCFIAGKKNRMERPLAKDFESAFLEASNKIIKCPSCGAWHYPRQTKGMYVPCPWCNGDSKPKAFLKFIDRLYEETDKDAKIEPKQLSEKQINTYMLLDNEKNQIKSYYILRADSEITESSSGSENYFSIIKSGSDYHVYNEFDKAGISIKSYSTKTFQYLARKGDKSKKDDIILKPGDEIYFGVIDNKAARISCGDKQYRFIRVAKFVEDKR